MYQGFRRGVEHVEHFLMFFSHAGECVYIISNSHTHIYIVCICFFVPQFHRCPKPLCIKALACLMMFHSVPQCSTKALIVSTFCLFDEQFISKMLLFFVFMWESHGDTLCQDAVNASAFCEFSASGED